MNDGSLQAVVFLAVFSLWNTLPTDTISLHISNFSHILSEVFELFQFYVLSGLVVLYVRDIFGYMHIFTFVLIYCNCFNVMY